MFASTLCVNKNKVYSEGLNLVWQKQSSSSVSGLFCTLKAPAFPSLCTTRKEVPEIHMQQGKLQKSCNLITPSTDSTIFSNAKDQFALAQSISKTGPKVNVLIHESGCI